MKIDQIIYNQFAPFMTKRPTAHPEVYKYEISSTREKNVCTLARTLGKRFGLFKHSA